MNKKHLILLTKLVLICFSTQLDASSFDTIEALAEDYAKSYERSCESSAYSQKYERKYRKMFRILRMEYSVITSESVRNRELNKIRSKQKAIAISKQRLRRNPTGVFQTEDYDDINLTPPIALPQPSSRVSGAYSDLGDSDLDIPKSIIDAIVELCRL